MKYTVKYISLTLCLFVSHCVLAQEHDEDSRWSVSLAVGAGIRTNPVVGNEDIPLVLIPHISYQGERFFIQNLDVGYSLTETENLQVNLLITPSYDQIFFNRWDANNFFSEANGFVDANFKYPTVESTAKTVSIDSIHERKMAALAGVEFIRSYQTVDVQLQALHEVTQYYNGDEIRFSISKLFSSGAHDIKLTVGANWQNKNTLNYFYGVTEAESSGEFTYMPTSGIAGLLRVDWNYKLNANWSLHFFSSYRHLSKPIVDSPLIEKNNVITAFVGGVYHF